MRGRRDEEQTRGMRERRIREGKKREKKRKGE